MNHIYRLVFNRALGVVQVVSELASASQGGRRACTAHGLRRTPLALACAGLLGMASVLAALPASAGDIVIPATNTPGNLSADTAGPGNISQTGAIIVGGTTTMVADGTITLTNAGNDFGGAVNLTGGTTQVTDANSLTLGMLDTGALTVVSTGALNLGSGSVGGNLSASSNGGAIGQAGALLVTGNTTLDAGTGAITLTDADNHFVGAVTATGNGIAITDSGSLTAATLTATGAGNVNLGAGGSLSAGSILTGGGNVVLTAAGSVDTGGISANGGNITLTSNGGALAVNGGLDGGNVGLTSADGLALNADVSAAGTLALRSVNAGIAQLAGSLSIAGATNATAAGAITLTSAANDFGGTVNLSAGGIAQITDSNALTLGSVNTRGLAANSSGALNLGSGTINGNLSAGSNGGAIGQAGALNVSGTSLLDAGSGNIALTNTGNDFQGAVSAIGTGIAITDANNLAIDSLGNGANGNVSLIAGNTLTLTTGAINTGTGNLTLASNGGTLATPGGLYGNNISLTGASGLALNYYAIATAALTLSSTSGGISQTGGNLLVGGTSTISGGSGAVSLVSAGNDFVGTVHLSGGNTQINDANALTLGTLATGALTAVSHGALNLGTGTVGGNLTATSNDGAIAQAGALNVSGTGTINAGAGSITLTQADNDFAGTLDLSGGATQVTDRNALVLGSVSTGALTVTSTGALGLGTGSVNGNLAATSNNGAISQSGALAVVGTSLFNAGNNTITLLAAGNDFTNVVASGGGISLSDANDLSVALTMTGNSILDAGGNLGVAGSTADLTTNAGATSFGATAASGNLQATSSGAISQSGALSVAGTSRFDAGANAITLANAGNDFGGAVSLANSGANNVSIRDANALLLGTSMFGSGTLALAANGISQSGALVQAAAGGAVTLDAGSGALILAHAGNDFSGAVSAAGNGVSITDANDLTIANLANGINGAVSLIAGGVLTLPLGAIDTGTANLILASNGGTLATTAALSGANISLRGRDGLLLGGAVNGSGSITLESDAGAILQTGALTTALLTGAAAGDALLTNAGNAIDTLGDFSASNFSLTNNLALAIAGTLAASGDIHLHDDLGITVTGAVDAGGSITLDAGTRMQIGDGGTAGSISGNVVDNGILAFDRSDAVTFTGAISGTGSLQQVGSGTLVLDGDSSGFLGSTSVQAGSLVVGGAAGNGAALGGDVDVASGATLGGHGSIGGDLTLANGAHLAPGNSIGTLAIDGDASFAQGSVLDFEFGTPGADFTTAGSGDSVAVAGDLTLDGAVLNVVDAGGMGPGLYTLFSYGGTLSYGNGGIVFGATPAGATLQLQTLTGARQINLLDTRGMTLNFWNGNGLASDTRMGGGDGSWSTTSMHWTDASGSVTAAMQPQPGFAIFGGDAGTVTIDNACGAVAATGLQFASDGYTLAGDALTLVADNGATPVIRVGDGSAGGSGMRATIGSVIGGSDGLAKGDLGTLVLNADNTFSGGLAINGGTLSVDRDSNLGAAANALTLDGGVLQVTGTAFQSTGRDVILGGNGGGFDIADAGNVFTLASNLAGNGAFAKTGAGTLVLTGANSWTGGTTIRAGTLQVGDGGSTGTLTGDIVNEAVLAFDRSDALAFAGAISGTGSLQQLGSGTTILLGTNTYSGGTLVGAGTLQVGDGGTAGSISGNVVDNGILAFDRSDAVTFTGAISGTGSLQQLGSGTLVLDGDSRAFAGSTQVVDGTLLVGGLADNGAVLGGDVAVAGGATLGGHGEIGGSVSNAGTLAPGTSIGTLTIHGDYTQAASGTLEVDVTPDGQADLLAVDGSATLAGGTVVVAIDGSWEPRTDYTILTAAGGVSGQFDSTSSNLVFLDAILGYGANTVTLSLQRNDTAFAVFAGTRNQRATAAAADTLAWGNAAHDALTMLDAASVPQAFDALSGEVHASTRAALLDDSRYLRDAIGQHLGEARSEAAAGAWIAGWGHWARSDSDGNADALRGDGLGFAIGADHRFGARTQLGVVAGSSRLSVRADARASAADVDSRHLGAYARLDAGWLQLQVGAARSWQQVGSQRAIAFSGYDDTLQADYDARTTQAYLDGSHAFTVGRGSLAPFLNLARVKVHSDGFDEAGGDAALRVAAASDERTYATLGMRWHAAMGAGDALRWQGSAGWTHASGGEDVAVNRQRFLDGSDQFEVAGTPIAGNAFAFDAGVRWQADPRVVIDASYVGRFASDARDQGARLMLNWAF